MEAAVDHIVLATPDMDRSVAFYSDVLEPEFISPGGIESPRAAFNSGVWGEGHAAYFLDPGGNHIEIEHYGEAGEPAE